MGVFEYLSKFDMGQTVMSGSEHQPSDLVWVHSESTYQEEGSPEAYPVRR